jgi:hypothetical protein
MSRPPFDLSSPGYGLPPPGGARWPARGRGCSRPCSWPCSWPGAAPRSRLPCTPFPRPPAAAPRRPAAGAWRRGGAAAAVAPQQPGSPAGGRRRGGAADLAARLQLRLGRAPGQPSAQPGRRQQRRGAGAPPSSPPRRRPPPPPCLPGPPAGSGSAQRPAPSAQPPAPSAQPPPPIPAGPGRADRGAAGGQHQHGPLARALLRQRAAERRGGVRGRRRAHALPPAHARALERAAAADAHGG